MEEFGRYNTTIPRLKDYRKPSDRKKERQKLYNRKDYREQVNWFKREHIWCSECLKDNLYTPGRDLHHILSPFDYGISNEEKIRRLYDQDNWELVCRLHHQIAHGTASQKDIDAYNERVKMLKEMRENEEYNNRIKQNKDE